MKKEVKSQAALEFLTTYAWAFLVILIMIGALAYFGVLSPSKLLPDRCNFGSEVSCSDFVITYGTASDGSEGKVILRLKNNVGEPIKVEGLASTGSTGITISTEAEAYSCTLAAIDDSTGTTSFTASPKTYTWNSGDVITVTYDPCDAGAVGFVKSSKAKVLVDINYYLAKSSSAFKHEVAGEVFTTVT